MTDTPQPHRATPEQWANVEKHAGQTWPSDACLLELRARVRELEQLQSWVPPTMADSIDSLDARLTELEQLHQAVVDLNERFSLDLLVARVKTLEAAQQQPAPTDAPQTLHTIALQMVDTLGRSFNLLPEILDTLRRAIREPMEGAPGVTIEPPELGSEQAFNLWHGPGSEEPAVNAARRIHRAGWDDAMKAVAVQRATQAAPDPVAAGSLVEVMRCAYESSSGTITNALGQEELPGPGTDEFTAILEVIADYLEDRNDHTGARWLREEADR